MGKSVDHDAGVGPGRPGRARSPSRPPGSVVGTGTLGHRRHAGGRTGTGPRAAAPDGSGHGGQRHARRDARQGGQPTDAEVAGDGVEIGVEGRPEVGEVALDGVLGVVREGVGQEQLEALRQVVAGLVELAQDRADRPEVGLEVGTGPTDDPRPDLPEVAQRGEHRRQLPTLVGEDLEALGQLVEGLGDLVLVLRERRRRAGRCCRWPARSHPSARRARRRRC